MKDLGKIFNTELEKALNAELDKLDFEIVRKLCYIGEMCVNKARTYGSYTDHSGNLRSSVGYVVVANGQIRQLAGFDAINGAKEGVLKGEEYARKCASEHPTDYALIIVAGMDYAEYVAAKGYDVLDSAELEAEKLIKQLFVD